jgi:hypothetical protein
MLASRMKKKIVFIGILVIFGVSLHILIFFVGYIHHNVSVQKNSVDFIRENDGSVLYDYEYDFHSKNNRIKNYEKPVEPPVFLIYFLGKDSLCSVVYVQLDLNKFGSIKIIIEKLIHLKSLKHLTLSGEISFVDILSILTALPQLRSLNLCKIDISDEDIRFLIDTFPNCSIKIFVNETKTAP